MHQERNTVITRQAMHNAVNLLCIVIVVGDIIIKFSRAVKMKQVIGLVNKYLVPHLLTVIVDEDVPHYCVHPSLEICTRSKFIHIAQRLKRCFLQQIVRLFPICRELIGKALQLRLNFKQFPFEFCSFQFVKYLNVIPAKSPGFEYRTSLLAILFQKQFQFMPAALRIQAALAAKRQCMLRVLPLFLMCPENSLHPL